VETKSERKKEGYMKTRSRFVSRAVLVGDVEPAAQ